MLAGVCLAAAGSWMAPGVRAEAPCEAPPCAGPLAQVLGSGDGRIHVVPVIAPYSVKNGESLRVTAVVRSQRPVASVVADLGGVARVHLRPDGRAGGVSPDGATGAWSGSWIAEGLEERVYRASVTITDIDGHSWTDHSLSFSDPAAGNSDVGTTAYPAAGMSLWTTEVLPSGEERLLAAAVDAVNGYAYFGTYDSPGRVVKVALGEGNAPPQRLHAITLQTGENFLLCAVIDPQGGHAYFGTDTSVGRVVKVALGEGDDPPERVGAASFAIGENRPWSAVIDIDGGHAYFGTATSPGRVVKVALGDGGDPPARVGSVQLHSGENNLYSAVIDPAGGHAYFGTATTPGRVVKVALGDGDDDPSRVGALELEAGENNLASAVIDTANGHAYFGTNTFPGRVVKVALGDGDDDPARLGAVELGPGENALYSAALDAARGHAYFATDTFPGRVVKVALGSGDDPPARLGALPLGSLDFRPWSGGIDAANGRAYFGTDTTPGRVVKISLDQRDALRATRFVLPEDGVVEDVRFHSHAADGNLRLALYDDAEPRSLLWQSGIVPNTGDDALVVVPITDGSPPTLTLEPGAYWAAWQTDSAQAVGSYAEGGAGDGFRLAMPGFDAPPAAIDPGDAQLSNDLWTIYIVYSDFSGVEKWAVLE